MTTLLSFLFTLAVLIVVHEFGHYVVARACGVKILRFSIGFGRILASRHDRHGTEWALSAVPLGGYVKMLDEREGEVSPEELPLAFNRKGIWRRMAIVVAGPAANFLLAVLLYWGLYATGVPAMKPLLAQAPAGTPAAAAGITSGERVLSLNGEKVASWQDLRLMALRDGFGAKDMRLETQDRQGQIHPRRLDLGKVDMAGYEDDPLRRLGLEPYTPPMEPVIGKVMPGGVAAKAGMRAGDRILAADGKPLTQWETFVKAVRAHPDQKLDLRLRRGPDELDLTLVPESVEQDGQRIGRIGAAPRVDPQLFAELQTELRYSIPNALVHGVRETWELSAFSLAMLGRMVLGQVSLHNLAGPITIADYAGQSASAGATAYIAFLAMISISLGILNLLPIPLLDGGHLLYYLVEFFSGRPVSEHVQAIGQKIGLALLAFLMFFALYNDLLRLLSP